MSTPTWDGTVPTTAHDAQTEQPTWIDVAFICLVFILMAAAATASLGVTYLFLASQ